MGVFLIGPFRWVPGKHPTCLGLPAWSWRNLNTFSFPMLSTGDAQHAQRCMECAALHSRRHLAEVLHQLSMRLVQRLRSGTSQLNLPARLQRDGAPSLLHVHEGVQHM